MPVTAVVNAITILRHLAMADGLGVNAVARGTGISPSSCFGILKTLVDQDFVDFDPDRKLYRLSSAPARLFQDNASLGEWTAWLKDQMTPIAIEFECCQGLWRIAADRAVLLEVVDSPLATRIHLAVGQRIPARIGAMGRCIAASEGAGPDDLRRNVEMLRWQAPPAIDDYVHSVEQARRGWAIDQGHYIRGVTTVAAAIADRGGVVRYCLTSILFDGQLSAKGLEGIGQRTAALAREAAQRLYGA